MALCNVARRSVKDTVAHYVETVEDAVHTAAEEAETVA